MKHRAMIAGGFAGLIALAGCVETTGAGFTTDSPFPVTSLSPDVSQAALNACRNAVAAQTQGGVEIVGSEFSQANNAVYLVVGPQRAPWRCLVSNDGRVAEVMFWGSEGAA